MSERYRRSDEADLTDLIVSVLGVVVALLVGAACVFFAGLKT